MDLFASPEPKILRPYQERAIALVRQSIASGNRCVVLQLPTGAGKTVIATRLILGALSKGHRVLFVAPAIDLIDQTLLALQSEGINDIGVMQACHPRTNSLARVQIATTQTLARRPIPAATLLIVDEAHLHSSVITDLLANRNDLYVIGLSATPWSKGMGLIWQDLVVPITISALIAAGHLSSFTVFAPDVPDLTKVAVRAGDFAEAALEKVMGQAQLVGSIVDTWLERGEDRPTLVFAVNRAHAAQLQAGFERRGICAAYVDGQTDRIERERIRRQFRAGEVRVICSVRTMTTGVDLPVSCIVDAAPTKSQILHVQKIGRGLRVNPGTEDCLILDHAGNSLRLGLVTDIHHDALDRTQAGDRSPRKTPAKLPKPCICCGVLHTGALCPACGHERKPVSKVETAPGNLVEITPPRWNDTLAVRQRFWSMARWLDRTRKKHGRLAKSLYRARFKEWPAGLDNAEQEPDAAFMNYELSRRIAFAKSKRG